MAAQIRPFVALLIQSGDLQAAGIASAYGSRAGAVGPQCLKLRLHSAARRALAGSARVSVEGAGTGEHHMPALPSKGKSRDLSFAASIPVSAYGVVKRLELVGLGKREDARG